MPQTKAQKKFEKKHLKDVLERRKKVAKIKQRKQTEEKAKAKRARDTGVGENNGAQSDDTAMKPNGNAFKDMSVDDFFAGGFDIPDGLKTKAEKANRVKTASAPKVGKRKRVSFEDDEDASEGSSTNSAHENANQHIAKESPSDTSSSEDDEMHQEQLDALKANDPQFYKYMEENEPELLEFNADKFAKLDAPGDDAKPKKRRKTEEISDDEEEEEDDDDEEDTGVPGSSVVTSTMLEKWERSMSEQHSLRATKEVVVAFAAAVSPNEDKQYKYSISTAEVYNKLLQVALKYIPDVLQHHVPVQTSKSGKVHLSLESKKFKTLTPMIKSYTGSIQRLLEGLSDAATQSLTLTSMVPLIPYVVSFRKLVKDLCKIVVGVWSEPGTTEATRIAAFLVMRRLVLIGDAGMRETVLRAAYQGLVKGSRNITVHNIQNINLMKNSAAELWGIDPGVGYTTGFTFIRQLAIHLRTSITQNSKESYKQVYNWQYVHSLDFWSRVLSQNCNSLKEAEIGKQSPLRPLIYPTVQVTLGAMRLIPTSQYFPLRFQLTRSLLRISQATGTFIPLAPTLYEVLTSRELKRRPQSSTLKALDLSTAIRAPKAYLRTRTYQDGVGEEVAELLAEYFVLWTNSIAFPELALPVCVMLKRWLKEVTSRSSGNKNDKVNNAVRLVVQKLETNSRWIEDRRAKIDFAPNNCAGVEGFLKREPWEKSPLGAYVVTMRRQKEERRKLIEEARIEEEKRRAERRAGDDTDEPFDGIRDADVSEDELEEGEDLE